MGLKSYPAEFPKGDHRPCQRLTELTLAHMPRDGSHGRGRTYRKGTTVWQPDDRADSIFFLLRGELAVVAGDAAGREVTLRVVGAGEPFGELCFCGGPSELRQTTVRALLPSEAVEIKLDIFMKYLQENREVLAAFVFTFCIRLADAEGRIEVLAHRGAVDRLGWLLVHLAHARGQAKAGLTGDVAVPVSHEELAQMAAMSRSHVTVTMGRLRRLGLVSYERNRPLFVDVLKLTAYLSSEQRRLKE
ncbi:MAG: Crp/Fnr family transcriptional regulator [Pyrinomonadaceae bacterium]